MPEWNWVCLVSNLVCWCLYDSVCRSYVDRFNAFIWYMWCSSAFFLFLFFFFSEYWSRSSERDIGFVWMYRVLEFMSDHWVQRPVDRLYFNFFSNLTQFQFLFLQYISHYIFFFLLCLLRISMAYDFVQHLLVGIFCEIIYATLEKSQCNVI